jgi:hypothetical protein
MCWLTSDDVPEIILETAENKRKEQPTVPLGVLGASYLKSGSGTPWLIRYSAVLEIVD